MATRRVTFAASAPRSQIDLPLVQRVCAGHPIEEQQPRTVVDLVLQRAGLEAVGGQLAPARRCRATRPPPPPGWRASRRRSGRAPTCSPRGPGASGSRTPPSRCTARTCRAPSPPSGARSRRPRTPAPTRRPAAPRDRRSPARPASWRPGRRPAGPPPGRSGRRLAPSRGQHRVGCADHRADLAGFGRGPEPVVEAHAGVTGHRTRLGGARRRRRARRPPR